MQITINYEYDPLQACNYFAKTEISGKTFYGAGDSFQKAKMNLLEKVKKFIENGGKTPEPETIENGGKTPEPETIELNLIRKEN